MRLLHRRETSLSSAGQLPVPSALHAQRSTLPSTLLLYPPFALCQAVFQTKPDLFFRKEKTPSDLDGVFKLQIEIGLDGADNAVVVIGRGDAVGQLFQLRMSVFHAIGQAGGLEQLGIV